MTGIDPVVFWVVVAVVGTFGLVIGSFLNVVIYRLPAGRSIVSPPSACPSCGKPVRWFDNIPVVSWLVLRGRCRDCSAPISVRYPLIELATGTLFALLAVRFLSGATVESSDAQLIALAVVLLAFLYLGAVGIALVAIDLETHRLPNVLVMPSYVVGIVLLAIAAIVLGDFAALIRAAIGMAVLFAAYLLMALAYPGGMGFGDVKLAGVIGLYLGWLGWGALIVGAFSAFLLGGIFSVALLVMRRASRKSGIPFGPWMIAGAFVGVFAGEQLWSGYLALFGLA